MNQHSHQRFASFLFLCAQPFACVIGAQDAFAQTAIADIVRRLHDEDIETRMAAVDDLEKMAEAGLSSADAKFALEAAAQSFPPLRFEELTSASGALVNAASTSRDVDLVDIVSEIYPKYPAPAKEQALLLLSSITSTESTDRFVKFVVEEAKNPTGMTFLPMRGFYDAPRHADRLFPALLLAMDRPELRWNAAYLALKYFENGQLEPGSLDASYGAVDEPLADLLRQAKRLELPNDDDWLWSDDYQEIRDLAGLLLDLSGYFETETSVRNLTSGVQSADPRLKFFAARSLMSLGRSVSDSALRDIAASSEVRNYLFEYLKATNQTRRFPAEFLSQEAFAESEMVNWLVYPTELGRAPSEIELVRTVKSKLRGQDVLHYVFKFRTEPPHFAAEDGWMLGVAGPFLASAAPDTTSYGDTFSTFAKLDETNVDRYVDEIRSLTRDAGAAESD
jgi:hypothetical protein